MYRTLQGFESRQWLPIRIAISQVYNDVLSNTHVLMKQRTGGRIPTVERRFEKLDTISDEQQTPEAEQPLQHQGLQKTDVVFDDHTNATSRARMTTPSFVHCLCTDVQVFDYMITHSATKA